MSNELVLPFYVLCDVSFSMTEVPDAGGASPLEALNTVVPSIRDAMLENPILSDKVRFALVDFSDHAQTQIGLCDLIRIQSGQVPTLTARGGTSFVAAFDFMRSLIETDVLQLKADNKKVHRPAVFFLTDGAPTDPADQWRNSFAQLTDPSFRARPNFIPFGVGEAQRDVLDQLVYPVGKMRSFVAKDGVDAAAAISEMAKMLIGSILASANSLDQGETGGFVPPDVDEDDVWI